MKLLNYILISLIVLFVLNSCLKDISETNNTEFPIKLELQSNSESNFSWSKLNKFGFKYYLVTRTKSTSEIFNDVNDIPSESIIKKITDIEINSFRDSAITESSYYRIYAVFNDKLFISNEIYWASNLLNLGSTSSYYIDLFYDDINNNLVIKSNNYLKLFDPVKKAVKLTRSFSFNSSSSYDYPDFYVGDVGNGSEVIENESSNIYFFDPLTLLPKDTIKSNSYSYGFFVSKDSIIHTLTSSYLYTYNRKTKKLISTNSLGLLGVDRIAYTSSDEIITSDNFDGYNFYKYNRIGKNITTVKTGFKGVSPNTFSFNEAFISNDGEYLYSYNSTNFFCYDKNMNIIFSKKLNANVQPYKLAISPNHKNFVYFGLTNDNNVEVDIYDFENMNTNPKIKFSKFNNITKYYVTNKYIFIIGIRLNPITFSNESYLETIEI